MPAKHRDSGLGVDMKSLMILLRYWMVMMNLAIVETSKQRAGWGGRADPRISSKSGE